MNVLNRTPDRVVLYRAFCAKLAAGGLTREEFNQLKNYPVGHVSLADFVKMNLRMGNLKWRDDKLVDSRRPNPLGLE